MKYSVCIDMMFSYLDFYERFTEAAKCRFDAVEFWKWSNKDIERVAVLLKENELKLSIFNLDSSDEKLSYDLSRGILNQGRADELISAVEESIPVYRKLGASAMIVLIGETLDLPYEKQIENIVTCLEKVKPLVEKENVNLVVEPLNDIDRKNYFLPRSKEVFDILKRIDSENIKLLFDIYHEQRMAGNLIDTITKNIDLIGHFHVADSPDRNEPGKGEINYPNVLESIKKSGYTKYVGLEYRATKKDSETLDFIRS